MDSHASAEHSSSATASPFRSHPKTDECKPVYGEKLLQARWAATHQDSREAKPQQQKGFWKKLQEIWQGEPKKPDIPSVYDEEEDFDTELEEDLIIEEEW